MSMRRVLLAAAAGGWVMASQAQEPAPQRTPRMFTGADATGDHVIALWQFAPGRETADNSNNGHTLALRGASLFSPDGLFGACLESFPVGAGNDKAVGAMAKNHPSLTPEGAFTLELWLKPKPELAEAKQSFLVDKKYFHYARSTPEANTDYGLYLQNAGNSRHVLTATLGFGTDSIWANSQAVQLDAGVWYHLAFVYDGAGTCRFFVDGRSVGKSVHAGRGALTPGRHNLVIGDRVGSTHVGCAAFIDQVRLCRGVLPEYAGLLEVSLGGARTVFRRFEADAAVTVTVANDTSAALADVTVEAALGDAVWRDSRATLGAGESFRIAVPVDTRLRPGAYAMRVTVAGGPAGERRAAEAAANLRIVSRPLPDRMPVLMWGHGDFERLQEIGFTHQLDYLVDYRRVWDEIGRAHV